MKREPEHRGPFWKHPLFLYAVIHIFIVGGMVLVGWLAWTRGWLPQ